MSDLQQAIIEALKASPPANMRALREALARTRVINSMGPVAAEIQKLRYQGKVLWDRLELSPSMVSAGGVASAVKAEGGGETTSTRPPSADGRVAAAPAHPGQPGPDDEEDSGVNDREPAGAGDEVNPNDRRRSTAHPDGPRSAFGADLRRAGVHASATRAAARPVPVPEHEPEIARLVREEATDTSRRRRMATSTGTVRQPLELRKYGVPDMTFSEAVGSMLSDDPKAIMRAVSRKHPAMWRRCILLGRASGQSPMQTLYAALEAGLAALETEIPDQQEQADAA